MGDATLKFAPNFNTLFQEEEVLNRFEVARRFGFSSFEAQNLYDYNYSDLLIAKDKWGLDMVLINTPPEVASVSGKQGDENHFGYACVPGKEAEFLKSLVQAIDFAKTLKCRKIHILAGLKHGKDQKILKDTYIKNLKVASDLLKKENILGVIEPLCAKVKPGYFLDDFNLAVDCLFQAGCSNLSLLLDIYHLEMIHGDAVSWIDKFYPFAGHIQVSQAPNREEPSARGLIDYRKVFQLLSDKKYDDFIGLEYFPKKSTIESLDFLKPKGIFAIDAQRFNYD